jgi:hypothetical protein
MKAAILGTGDLTKIPRYTEMKEDELRKLIEDVSEVLVKKEYEIVIVPDRGVPIEVAKIYKEKGGKKVYGLVPTKDTKFGDRHIQPYLHLLDERIELDHWYDVDGEIAAAGDVCIVIGLSPGIMREVSVLKYHRRYLDSKTKVIWFRNTMSQPIQKEIEEEIPITYVSSVEELEKIL